MKIPVNRESATPMGTYQVWHREGDEFRHVGSLKVSSLPVAAEAALNRPPAHWMDGEVPDVARRTRTGDVIVTPDGGASLLKETVYGFTLEQTDFGQLKQLVKELAELREEARTGVLDGLVAGALFKDVMRDAGLYGVKPEEVAEIRKQIEREGHGR